MGNGESTVRTETLEEQKVVDAEKVCVSECFYTHFQ
jgi:hypothetical protein